MRSVRQQRWDSTTLRDTIIRASTLLGRGAPAVALQRITDPVCTRSIHRDSVVRVKQENCWFSDIERKTRLCSGGRTVFQMRASAEQQPQPN